LGVTWDTRDGPGSNPAATRYIPAKITAVCSGERSTKNAKIEESPVEINGRQFIVYANEYPQEDELGFMLREEGDVVDVYNFNGTPTATRIPTTFYVPTRLLGKNKAGETVAATKFEYAGKAQEGIPITLETFGYDDKEFFRPTSPDGNTTYFIPVFGPSENLSRDRRTGIVTLFGENGDGILEEGEGIFGLTKRTYQEIEGRKKAYEKAKADKIQSEKNRLQAEKEKAEREAEEKLKEPQSGTGKPIFE
ncbi:MAG: hypothetical protein KKE05_02595, partial [Nanoarchaeota archaeon]|nr:hypothetical protein [Nanoarchaeota archaeon]